MYMYIYIYMSFITAKGLASERDTVRICPSIKHGHGPWQWSPTEQHLPWEPRKGGLNSLLSWMGRRHAPTQIQHFRSFFVQTTSMMSSKSFWEGSRMLFRIWTLTGVTQPTVHNTPSWGFAAFQVTRHSRQFPQRRSFVAARMRWERLACSGGTTHDLTESSPWSGIAV